jgi:hypothetical protein
MTDLTREEIAEQLRWCEEALAEITPWDDPPLHVKKKIADLEREIALCRLALRGLDAKLSEIVAGHNCRLLWNEVVSRLGAGDTVSDLYPTTMKLIDRLEARVKELEGLVEEAEVGLTVTVDALKTLDQDALGHEFTQGGESVWYYRDEMIDRHEGLLTRISEAPRKEAEDG